MKHPLVQLVAQPSFLAGLLAVVLATSFPEFVERDQHWTQLYVVNECV